MTDKNKPETPVAETISAGLAGAGEANIEDLKEAAPEDGDFKGQIVQTEHFFISTKEPLQGQAIEISPAGWVGPAPLVIPVAYFPELKTALGKIKNLPKP